MKKSNSTILKVLVHFFTIITFSIITFIVMYIFIKGIPNLKLSLFSPVYTSENVSLLPSLINTIFMIILSLLFALPFGIGGGVYLCEYSKKGSRIVTFINVTLETLSGIPSIIYGLFGSLFFVKFLHFGLSLLSGSLTLSIMILPIITSTTVEALKSVKDDLREGSYALGCSKSRTIFCVVLPSAFPGILSGIILSVGRIVGESAALIFTSGTVAEVANSIFSSSRTLSLHMYILSSEGLHLEECYASGVVLLILVILINMFSLKLSKKIKRRSMGE